MTDDVSFYVIAILTLGVKSHSLQERNVLGNVLIVDHHIKKMYIYICLDLIKGTSRNFKCVLTI